MLKADPLLVTSEYVVLETWRLLHHKIGWAAAEKFLESLRAGIANVEQVNAADLDRAWSIGQDYPDQEFAFTDRTSFAVMMRLGVRRVASFDRDFAVFRFGKRKAEAFEIVG